MKRLMLGIATLAISLPLLARDDGPNPCEFQHYPKTFNCALKDKREGMKQNSDKVQKSTKQKREKIKHWPLREEDRRR
ncbi:hypothetical protein [Endozoicomonas euniceicola]|uniref:Uncharacterized protein n=1 Tax=Endozoicomonas euniceicola TaxID=1234143 RepID=A0ABY6GQG6_9GAMM|nr:hypothetical protein [Endozoicomonas euniceicola]UYM14992.1 hypothetical protein NX720_19265 [Endozoicomonas euniceicola]